MKFLIIVSVAAVLGPIVCFIGILAWTEFESVFQSVKDSIDARIESRKYLRKQLRVYGIECTKKNIGLFRQMGEAKALAKILGQRAVDPLFQAIFSSYSVTRTEQLAEEIALLDQRKGQLIQDTMARLRYALPLSKGGDRAILMQYLPEALRISYHGDSFEVEYLKEQGHYDSGSSDCGHTCCPELSCWGSCSSEPVSSEPVWIVDKPEEYRIIARGHKANQ